MKESNEIETSDNLTEYKMNSDVSNVPYPFNHHVNLLKDLNEINSYVNDPFAWLIGQFIKHILVMNEETIKLINKEISLKNIKKPYVG
jgi:hypothetical protein